MLWYQATRLRAMNSEASLRSLTTVLFFKEDILMFLYNVEVDVSRGFDVMQGKKVLKHFDNYAEARALADSKKSLVIRYYAKKTEAK